MKNFKFAIALGFSISTLFMSCTKKSDDPKPIIEPITEQTNTKTNVDDVIISPWYIFKNDTAINDITPYLSTKWKSLNPDNKKDTITVSFEKVYQKNRINFDLYYVNLKITHTDTINNYLPTINHQYFCYNNNIYYQIIYQEPNNNKVNLLITQENKLKINKISNKIIKISLIISDTENLLNTYYTLNKVII